MQGLVEHAARLPSHSWEYGATSIAFLELFSPELSEYSASPFQNPPVDPTTVPALQAGLEWITLGSPPNSLSNGDGATGDPASLGPVAYLIGQTNSDYATATKEQLEYLITGAPRSSDGTISHRADVVELWADFVFMAPPFIAYYGAQTNNASLVREAYVQSRGYRDALKSDTGAWKHIVGPQSADLGLWSTGNAWAAAGMARVLATTLHAPKTIPSDSEAINGLTSFVKEIIDAAIAVPKGDNGLIPNYLYSDEKWFGEVSGSALLTATAYRMAVLRPDVFGWWYVQWAEGMRKTLARHISKEGIAAPAINPLNWGDKVPVTTGSPEGQAFAVMMYAAWRDCIHANVCQSS